MPIDLITHSFNAGEFSPLLDGRSDLEKYFSACRLLENMIPLPYGPAERRPGTYFVAELKDNDKKARLIPFQYSTEQAYILEYGDEYIRFYMDRGQIQTGVGTEDLSAFDIAYTIDAVDTVAETFTISGDGDLTDLFPDGSAFYVFGSTGNDDPWFVSSTNYTAPDFVITVTGNITDATVDGEITQCCGHWKLNDNAANTAVDNASSIGATADGVASTDTDDLHVTGKVGTGSFDFKGSEYVGSISILFLLGDGGNDSPLTILAWVYVTDAGGIRTILSKWNEKINEREWTFELTTDRKIKFLVFDESVDKSAYITSDDALSLGWRFVAVTYDGSGGAAAATGMALYVDGAAVNSTATNDDNYIAIEDTSAYIFIGAKDDVGGDGASHIYDDKIDNVALFSNEFSAANIASLYTTGAYEITSSYQETNLPGLQHIQSADVLYNLHSDYKPSKLMRYAHDCWKLEDIVFDWPPFLKENDTDISITPIGVGAPIVVGAAVTLIASASLFTSEHVGSYWLIKYPRTADETIAPNSVTSSEADDLFNAAGEMTDNLTDVKGSWRFRTAGTWTGEVVIERSYDDGTTWHTLEPFKSSGDQNFNVSGEETENDVYYRARWISGAGPCEPTLSVERHYHYGIVKITGFTSATKVTGEVIKAINRSSTYTNKYAFVDSNPDTITDADSNFINDGFAAGQVITVSGSTSNDGTYTIDTVDAGTITLIATDTLTAEGVGATVTIGIATKLWSEGAWSDKQGYPVAPAFYEGRMWYAGTPSQPLDIWGSRVQDYENFEIGTLDDDSVKFTVDSGMQNMIRWLVGQEVLLIGTSGAEWKLGSSDPADAITPSNPIKPRIQTTYGSKEIQALLLANVILFVDDQGRAVRGAQYIWEQGETGKYDAPNYAMFAEHITESGIVGMAYQQNPHPILWCVRDDGVLIGMTFEPGQKVWGWFRCAIDGEVESVAVIRGVTEDEVWIIVKREINGLTKRYIEYFKPRDWGDDQADCFFVDSGLTFDGGAAVTITGITKADPCVVTAANTFSDGDQIKIVGVVGMTEVNNKVYTISNPTAANFELRDKLDTVDIDSTGFTLYVSGGTAQQVDNTFSGLGHLEGETVSVLGDGSVHADVVVNSAKVVLTEYYNKVHIGRPFVSKLMPMKIELQTQTGSARAKKKKISQILFSFYKTLGAEFGTTEGSEIIPFRKTTDPMGSPPPLFTGEKVQTFPGGYELNGDIYVEQKQPLPMTVRSITARMQIYG